MERVQGYQTDVVATIASGQTASSAILFRGYAQGGFVLPAAFTGATVGFSVSADGVTYGTLYDSANAAVSVTVTQARAYAFPIAVFPFGYVKIVSASAEGADRSISVSLKY